MGGSEGGIKDLSHRVMPRVCVSPAVAQHRGGGGRLKGSRQRRNMRERGYQWGGGEGKGKGGGKRQDLHSSPGALGGNRRQSVRLFLKPVPKSLLFIPQKKHSIVLQETEN